MVSEGLFWLVARQLQLFVTTDLNTRFPWAYSAPWTVIVVIVVAILVQPRAVVDILRALADLAWAIQGPARAVLA
jgi:hypothetical protein